MKRGLLVEKIVIFFAVVLLLFTTAEVNAGGVGISQDTGGYLVGYTFDSGRMLGLRISPEKDFSYFGLKFFNPIEKFSTKEFKTFVGVEGNFVSSFEGQNSKGNGYMGYLSLGVNYSLGKINILFEIGPGIVYLKDKSSGIKITEVDPTVYNVGFGFRF